MVLVLVEENGFRGMLANRGGQVGNATQINEIGG
jgi:hypothetical protein